MGREYIFIWYLTCLLFFLHFKDFYFKAEGSENEYSKGCAHLRCEYGSRCVKQRFWCKNPPCPGMLYCYKSRKERLKGPSTCDTVRCSSGHICIVRVRGCRWDGNCQQQIARCISEKEYHEGPTVCAGFNCPSGERCILRETHCDDPPCKLNRSCADAQDVKVWHDKCKSFNCTSEYECFLRRSESNCHGERCLHTPDCTLTIEAELVSKYCYGWICPRGRRCSVQIVGACKGFNCTVKRSCRASSISSIKHDTDTSDKVADPTRKTLMQIESETIRQEMERGTNTQLDYAITTEKPTSAASSILMQSVCHTTPAKHEAEVSTIHQEIAITNSNLITKLPKFSTDDSYLTMSHPRSLNQNKLSTIDIIEDELFKTTSGFFDSGNSTFPTISPVDRKITPTASRDTKKLEAPKEIYDDTLSFPVISEGVDFVGRGYPIWIKNDPFYTLSPNAKDVDNDEWGYRMPQEPYRILLPPYEPVIIVEDARRQGQFFPFFTYAFDYPFDDAALISLPEITSRDIMRDAKTNNIPTIANDETGNNVNTFIVGTKNFRTNHFDDTSDNYANVPMMKRTSTVSSNIHNERLNYYDD